VRCSICSMAKPMASLCLLRQTVSKRLTDKVGCLGARLVSGGGDRQVFVWDVATGRTIRKFRGHDGIVNTVCFPAGPAPLQASH
jgi:WD40 repeat protein